MPYYPFYSPSFIPTPTSSSHFKEPLKPAFLIRDEVCSKRNLGPFSDYYLASRSDQRLEGRDHKKSIQNPFTSSRSFIQLISPPESPEKAVHFIERMNYQMKYTEDDPEVKPIIESIYSTFGPTTPLEKNKSNLSIIDELIKINAPDRNRPLINYEQSKVVVSEINESNGFIQEQQNKIYEPLSPLSRPARTINLRGREYYLADVVDYN